MKRRTAIKNISIGMGVSVSMGTFLSMIASCKSEPADAVIDTWKASFLTDNKQLRFVENLADAILPATDTPGAKEIGVIKYIDMAVAELYKPNEQERFKKGMEICISTIEKEQGAEVSKLTAKQFTAFLENHIGKNANKETAEIRREMLEKDEPPADEQGQKEYFLYSFLTSLKGLTVGGYFGNEIVGTEHMNYDPVPGPFQGCIDYSGNNYSL